LKKNDRQQKKIDKKRNEASDRNQEQKAKNINS